MPDPRPAVPPLDLDAVVLVGGRGVRLHPLTLGTPKPMLPAAGVPLLTHLLARLAGAGVRRVLLCTSYRPEVFADHFGDGAGLGLRLEQVTEDTPLDTGGAVRNVLPRLRTRDVLVLNGDVLSGVDLRGLVRRHRDRAADVTLHLTRVPDPRRFGSVPTDAAGRVLAYAEKSPRPTTDQVNAGCYVVRTEVLERIPAGRPVSVDRETFPGLVAAGLDLVGHVDPAYWLDVGTPASFVRGCADLVLGAAPSPALPGPPGPALVLPGAAVAAGAVLAGGTTVGAGGTVADGARLDAAVLFDGAQVGAGASVVRSVLGRGAVVGPGAVVADAVVGDDVVVGAGTELRGARVWPGARLEAGAGRLPAPAVPA